MNINDLIDNESLEKIQNLGNDKEYCCIIRNKKLIIEVHNFSQNPDVILIDSDFIEPGDIVLHTHYSDSQPGRFSLRDIKTAKANNQKIMLYHTKFKEWDYYDPEYSHPYPLLISGDKLSLKKFLGLRYEPIRCDCYSFCRDVAKGIYNLEIPDLFKMKMKYADLKMFFTEPEKLGFKRTNNIEPGNFVLLNLSVDVPFHMGVLIGEKTMVHSLSNKQPTGLINIENLGKNIMGFYSHEGVAD